MRAERGFSLLEVSVALAILATIAAAILPLVLGRARLGAAEAAARDMAGILDAARQFYAAQPVSQLRWPAGLDELRASGYLPAGFSGVSPFSTAYEAGPSGGRFTVSVLAPADVAGALARLLPLATTETEAGGVRVTGAVPAPGVSADVSAMLHRGGTTEGSFMWGPLRIADGTEAAGRVLTADASGTGRWAPSGVPAGTVAFFALSACPEGWTAFPEAQGRYIVGLPPGGTLMAQVGTALADGENRPVGRHTHSLSDPGHAHAVSIPTGPAGSGAAAVATAGSVTGSLDLTSARAGTGAAVSEAGLVDGTNAPYVQLLACRKT